MTSWEIAIIVGVIAIPFYLDKLGEKFKQESKFIKIFIFLVNMAIFLGALRIAKQIADLNNSPIATMVSIIYVSWLWITIILTLFFLIIILPSEFIDRRKQKKKMRGLIYND